MNGTPRSHEEYLARFAANQHYFGFGLETGLSMPCPFCAAADFLASRILEVEQKLEVGATCRECARSAKAIFTREPGITRFEIVQTGGPDQPDWLLPKMRRVG